MPPPGSRHRGGDSIRSAARSDCSRPREAGKASLRDLHHLLLTHGCTFQKLLRKQRGDLTGQGWGQVIQPGGPATQPSVTAPPWAGLWEPERKARVVLMSFTGKQGPQTLQGHHLWSTWALLRPTPGAASLSAQPPLELDPRRWLSAAGPPGLSPAMARTPVLALRAGTRRWDLEAPLQCLEGGDWFLWTDRGLRENSPGTTLEDSLSIFCSPRTIHPPMPAPSHLFGGPSSPLLDCCL